MKTVRATLSHDINFRARGTARIGSIVCCGNAKLLYGIGRHAENGRECIPPGLVIGVDTVQEDVALVAARTVHSTAAGVDILVDVRVVSKIGDTRLERI